jgi:NADPH2:quinone reductase
MKAIVIQETGGPEVVLVRQVPDPVPGPEEVLIQVHASGVNPVDVYHRQGTIYKPQLPYIPGWDGAGDIVAIGSEVDATKVPELGSRVWFHHRPGGSLAELVAVPFDRVFALPDTLTYDQGAALGVPYATAWRALRDRGEIIPGCHVLIHGASGGVGLAAIQIALSHKALVWGTAGTREGRMLVMGSGAEAVFDHHDPDHFASSKAATDDARGFDIILENLANINLTKDLEILAPGGRVVVVGNRGTVEINPRDLMMRDADIRGMSLLVLQPQVLTRVLRYVQRGVLSGDFVPVVGQTYPLAEAGAAQERVIAGGADGKVVVRCQE